MRVRRVPVIDLYVEDEGCVVFVGDQVVGLSALATQALLAVGEEWTEDSAVASALADAFGPPPPDTDLAAATAETLKALSELRVIEHD